MPVAESLVSQEIQNELNFAIQDRFHDTLVRALIVPAYNEVATIQKTLRSIDRYLGQRRYTYEVIVAADGTDGTREAAQALAGELPVKVLGMPERRGKGRGVREGIQSATGEIIGFLDADYKGVAIDEIGEGSPVV